LVALAGDHVLDPAEGRLAHETLLLALRPSETESVRECAVREMGRNYEPDGINAVAVMVRDPVPAVRIAVAEVLAGQSVEQAWQALVRLLEDCTNTSEAARNGSPEAEPSTYGVALAAAKALSDLHVWDPDLEAAVADFLDGGSETAADVEIRDVLECARERATR
jgi:hypothetical protein